LDYLNLPRESHPTKNILKMNKVNRTNKINYSRISLNKTNFWLITSFLIILTSCSIGKDYKRPELTFMPQGFKYAEPSNIDLDEKWWYFFADNYLSSLIDELTEQNLNLAISKARYDAAKAAVSGSYSSFWPDFNLGASKRKSNAAESYNANISASWQLDLWGKVRRQLESDRANLKASSYDLAALKLSLIAELTQHYLQIGMLDAERQLLTATLSSYQRSLQITQDKYDAGIVPKSDVTQARTQVKNTQIQLLNLNQQRILHENALAILLGKAPDSFNLPKQIQLPQLPLVDADLPSRLLERRPDIASIEQKIIATNAGIGVAQAAYFPDFSFSANVGYSAPYSHNLISSDNRSWSVGPSINLGLLDFGRRKAQVKRAKANHEQMVFQYRQAVLTAIREVEDALIALKFMAQQRVLYDETLAASKESLYLMKEQYKAGKVDYQNVVNLQINVVNHERNLISLQANQLKTIVQLITALGGGWQMSDEKDP